MLHTSTVPVLIHIQVGSIEQTTLPYIQQWWLSCEFGEIINRYSMFITDSMFILMENNDCRKIIAHIDTKYTYYCVYRHIYSIHIKYNVWKKISAACGLLMVLLTIYVCMTQSYHWEKISCRCSLCLESHSTECYEGIIVCMRLVGNNMKTTRIHIQAKGVKITTSSWALPIYV